MGLKTFVNQFRPGLCSGPHWGSLQRSQAPSWWEEGSLPLPKNHTPSRPFRNRCLHPETPPPKPKITPIVTALDRTSHVTVVHSPPPSLAYGPRLYLLCTRRDCH